MEGGAPLIVARVRGTTRGKQQPRHSVMAVQRGYVQRSAAIVSRGTRNRARSKQRRGHLGVPEFGR